MERPSMFQPIQESFSLLVVSPYRGIASGVIGKQLKISGEALTVC